MYWHTHHPAHSSTSNHLQAPSFSPSLGALGVATMEDPFGEAFSDPLCKLTLKETSEFVKSLPMSSTHVRRERESLVTKKSNVEAPCTPGRPIFSFSSAGNHHHLLQRKSFPSKWDDAGKWLNNNSPGHDSPSQLSKDCRKFEGFKLKGEAFTEKPVVAEDMFSKAVSSIQVSLASNGVLASGHVLLKDKFTDEAEPVYPKYRSLEPVNEGFLFGNSEEKTEVVREVKHRDVGTEMTPIGSSTTSRCHTPFMSTSPVRHNTPENRSGPLALSNSTSTTIDITHHHLEKLHGGSQFDSSAVVMASAWGSREEEEEDISKSLRHFEIGNGCRRSVSEAKGGCTWEEEEKNKCCLRYQREEARIEAWLNLQNAKAEAQRRKLEVKIQKMRSNLEEKTMKRMSVFHRKAEEWRAAAQLQHSEQIDKMTKESQKMIKTRQRANFSGHSSCSCFPCSNNHHL